MEKNIAYNVGFIVGIVSVMVIAVIVAMIKKKKGEPASVYDERQEIARGKAYKAGYFTLVIYIVVISVVQMWLENIVLLTFAGLWIGVALSVGVFVIICIIQEAYVSLVQKPIGIIIGFIIPAVSNIVGGIPMLKKYGVIENNQLSNGIVNISCGILFGVLSVVLIGKQVYNLFYSEMEE